MMLNDSEVFRLEGFSGLHCSERMIETLEVRGKSTVA
jgi:hypothetical protein